MSNGEVTRSCVVCEGEFKTWVREGAWGRACQDCRQAFGVRSDRSAEALLEAIKGKSKEERLKLLKEAKETQPQDRFLPLGPAASASAKPKVDPEKVAAGVRLMTEYGRLVHDIDERRPLQQPTTYVIAKNGLFEVRETDLSRIIIQPKEVAGVTQELKQGFELKIPRLPFKILSQTVAFFRETCKRQNGSSEAIIQVFWNVQKKEFHIHIPSQEVSGGGVRHTSGFDPEGERDADGNAVWLHVMDIHSHGSSMAAFWSGVDDGDERKAPEGRMFGVIGKVNQPIPAWKWRMRTREGFIDLGVSDIFEVDMKTAVPFQVTWDVILQAASQEGGVTPEGMVKLSCPVDPFKNATCPAEWHERVKGYSTGYRGPHSHGHSGQGYFGFGSQLRGYLYIGNEDETELSEYEVDGAVTKATGKVLKLKEGRDGRSK